MFKNEVLKKSIDVRLEENETSIVVKSNFNRYVSPYFEAEKMEREKFTEQFKVLPKEEVHELLTQTNMELEAKAEAIKELLADYAELHVNSIYFNKELAIFERIEEIQEYFKNHESTFGEVKREIRNLSDLTVRISNGVYSLVVYANKYGNKNYQIRGYLSLNHLLSERSDDIIERFENTSYALEEKMENYIANKLKKYNHLFTVNKAILDEHVQIYRVHSRIIKDTGIQVFDNEEAMRKAHKI